MKRRKFTAKFKTKVVLEALKESTTMNELAQKHSLSPQQISKWKNEFIQGAESIFSREKVKQKSDEEKERDRLLRTVGELKMENDFLKKTLQ